MILTRVVSQDEWCVVVFKPKALRNFEMIIRGGYGTEGGLFGR
jgi:hypothetical protein